MSKLRFYQGKHLNLLFFFIIFWVISLDYLLIISYFVFTYVPTFFFLNREPSWEIVCITFHQTSFIKQNYDNLFVVEAQWHTTGLKVLSSKLLASGNKYSI